MKLGTARRKLVNYIGLGITRHRPKRRHGRAQSHARRQGYYAYDRGVRRRGRRR